MVPSRCLDFRSCESRTVNSRKSQRLTEFVHGVKGVTKVLARPPSRGRPGIFFERIRQGYWPRCSRHQRGELMEKVLLRQNHQMTHIVLYTHVKRSIIDPIPMRFFEGHERLHWRRFQWIRTWQRIDLETGSLRHMDQTSQR